MRNLKPIAAILFGITLSITTGCGVQSKHPNQINAFDGSSYDSLTLAHAALLSLRGTISASYPAYAPAFNQAAASYSVAYNSYALFRTASANQAEAALALSNLTVSVISLENTIQTDLHVSPQVVSEVQNRAVHIRAAMAPKISVSDILSELEIAATIAESVPGTQPYSTLAAIVIKTTQEAVAALSSSSGQPIDLSTIQPIAPIQ